MQSHRLTEISDSLIDEIAFEIPEAPEPAIELSLKNAIVEFCELSHYWVEDIGPQKVISGIAEYDVVPSGYTAIVSITGINATDSSGCITVLERSQSDDVKYRFWQDTPFTISIYPADELADSDLSIYAALKPRIDASQFEFSENLLIDYRDAILAGAKARLYQIPRKPWYDPNLYQKNQSLFNEKSSEALRTKARGYSRLPDRSVPKPRSYY